MMTYYSTDLFVERAMALSVPTGAPTLFFRRQAYEASGLTRAQIDERLGLTTDEFRVEGDLVAVVIDKTALHPSAAAATESPPSINLEQIEGSGASLIRPVPGQRGSHSISIWSLNTARSGTRRPSKVSGRAHAKRSIRTDPGYFTT